MIRLTSYSSFSCRGSRDNQEDFVHPVSRGKDERVFVLCDGMGGHGHGEVASKTIAESMYETLVQLNPPEYAPQHLQDALDTSLIKLKEADVFHDEKPMGTTLVVVTINKMSVLIGHIGDSRCYLFDSDGKRKFRTKDHSKVQEAVDAEILTEEEAWSNPKKNLLTRCILSSSSDLSIDVDTLVIEDGDTLLICSDGVTDAMKDNQIQSVVIGRDSQEIAAAITAECDLSSHDNFSAIIIQLSQDEKNVPQDIKTPPEFKPKKSLVTVHAFCPHCGATINKDAVYCPHCGRRKDEIVVGDPIRNNGNGNRPKDITAFLNNNLYLIIGGILICGLCAWGIHSCFSHHNPEPKQDEHQKCVEAAVSQVNPLMNEASRADTIDSVSDTSTLNNYQHFLDNLINK